MRRDFLKLLGLAGLQLALPWRSPPVRAAEKTSDAYPGPYYVVFNASGGWDTTYLMDPKGIHEINRLYKEGDILAIASKIVALCQGRTVAMTAAEKATLVEAESSWFLPQAISRYAVYLTIKAHALMPYAGIDESNSDGRYVLWPHAPQEAANALCGWLRRRFGLRHAGVIITDSRPLPLR